MPDTAAAQESLRIAKGYYDRLLSEHQKLSPNQHLDCIKFAAHHLANARAADPTAHLEVQTPKGTTTYTQEFLSAQILYFQAKREAALDDEEGCLKSLETLKQASVYAPDRPYIHRAIAEVLLKLFRRDEALTAAQFALMLDPADMDSRLLVDKITTTPSVGVPEVIPGARSSDFGHSTWKLGMILTFVAPIGLAVIGLASLAVGSVITGVVLCIVGLKIKDYGDGTKYLHNALRKDEYR